LRQSTFDAFVDRLTHDVSGPDTQWVTMRTEWLQYVEIFFGSIQFYLKSYTDQGKISFTPGVKENFEENIGVYKVKTATVKIGSNIVKFDPVGTNLIGARGRIDMIGPHGMIRFLLVDEAAKGPRVFRGGVHRIKEDTEIKWAWKIATDPPNIQYLDLNEDVFFEALMDVINA
jgi:hypothetical protein